MALNNNDDLRNKKRQKTEVVEHVDQDTSNDSVSLPLSVSAVVVVVVPPALSFGTILEEFPDFLSCVLLCIADRVIWNSIAASNKDIHAKSKAILPPWPLCYKLPSDSGCWAWSPCGTRIACSVRYTNIKIFDQQLGPLHNHWNVHDERYDIIDLKYSPDGRFLVSTGNDDFVRLWDTVTGNYDLLREWNMEGEVVRPYNVLADVCVSACSKYIAVATKTHVFLKDVEDGKTISIFAQTRGFAQNDNRIDIRNIMFSSHGRTIFICGKQHHQGIIKVWRPYLDDDDEDRLISLTRKPDKLSAFNKYKFSKDNTMVVIHNRETNTGMLWSIDMDHNCLKQKSKFPAEGRNPYFTPDDKYIVCNKENRPKFWSIAEGKFTKNLIHFLDNGSNCTKHNNLAVQSYVSCSPNNRQCIVQAAGSGNHYTISYFVTE